jgi:hypothetical protein
VCRVANAEFDGVAASVSSTRHFVAGCLRRWDVVDLEEVALLPSVRVPVLPTNGMAHGEAWANRGRGLVLVDRLADEWGVAGLPQGKHVWFRLRKDDWAFRLACRCDNEDVDRIRMGSGNFISVNTGPWDFQC